MSCRWAASGSALLSPLATTIEWPAKPPSKRALPRPVPISPDPAVWKWRCSREAAVGPSGATDEKP